MAWKLVKDQLYEGRTIGTEGGVSLLLLLLLLLLLSDALHKNVSKAASRAQSQLDIEKPHRVEDILNK